MTTLRGVRFGLLVLGVLLCAGGCVSDRPPQFGRVTDVQPGGYVPDFSFVGTDGKMERFSRVRGNVTLVAFPRQAGWTETEMCRDLEQFAKLHSSSTTLVSIVVIGVPVRPCAMKDCNFYQSTKPGRAQLVALEDHRNRVAALYGKDAIGKYYVIDYTGRVAASGSLDDAAAMKRAVTAAVREHDAYWKDLNPQTGDY